MRNLTTLILMIISSIFVLPVVADIFKYIDREGNIYFTDIPLTGNRYRLEWRRETQRLIKEQQGGWTVPRSTSRMLTKTKITPRSNVSNSLLAQRRALYERLITANAHRFGLAPGLLHAVIRTESAYDPAAVSPAGAQGLMQLMPDTAARYGVADSFNPVDNVRGGAAYLHDLLNLFNQNVRLALAGYNAGEGAVIKYGRQIPPYPETQEYVRRVLQYYSAEQPQDLALGTRSNFSVITLPR